MLIYFGIPLTIHLSAPSESGFDVRTVCLGGMRASLLVLAYGLPKSMLANFSKTGEFGKGKTRQDREPRRLAVGTSSYFTYG